jgi:hypothetical protein
MLVVTVTTQRSGSKFLGLCFLAGTVVSPFGEVFNPDADLAGGFRSFVAARNRSIANTSGREVLDEYFATMTAIRGIPSLDIMFNQLEIPCLTWNPYDSHFIYGYLKDTGSVVISLERDLVETYVSQRYLALKGGPAHTYDRTASAAEDLRGLVLDANDYRWYRKRTVWHRTRLYEAMHDYRYFYRLDYAQLAKLQRVPPELCNMIERMATERRMTINQNHIQVHDPGIFRTNVEYAAAFSNYEEIRKLEEALQGGGSARGQTGDRG